MHKKYLQYLSEKKSFEKTFFTKVKKKTGNFNHFDFFFYGYWIAEIGRLEL